MLADKMRTHLDDFTRERQERRHARRAGAPTLALILSPLLPAPYSPAETAAEAEAMLRDYFRSDEAGRRGIAQAARVTGDRGR